MSRRDEREHQKRILEEVESKMGIKINSKAHIPSNKHMDGATCLNGAGINGRKSK